MKAINPAVLADLAKLPYNWDSYGSSKISKEAIKALDNIHVVPTSIGGWILEMRLSGADVDIEITPDGTVDSVWHKRTPTDDT